MGDFKTKFKSTSQEWETPQNLFDSLNHEFNFSIDVCASRLNTKCEKFFSKEENALVKKWEGVCWMNPPFNELQLWTKKAYNESQKGGCLVVCLIPVRSNTRWWNQFCMKGEIRFIIGRPKFEGSKHGLPQPLAIIIFNGNESKNFKTIDINQLNDRPA